MSIPPITIVIEPPRLELGSPEERAEALDYQLAIHHRLAESLREIGEMEVEVVTSFLRDVAPSGLVFLDPSTTLAATLGECSEALQEALPARIVLINADRSNVLQLLEQFGLAGAVEKHRFFLWSTQTQPDGGFGLYGRYSVAEAIEADDILGGPFRSERYCLFGSHRYAGLPELMVAYLERYSEEFIAVPLEA